MADGKKDTQARGWVLTLPLEHYSRHEVVEALGSWPYVGQLEEGGETGYRHWQILVENASPIRFSTLRRKFPKGHYEARRASVAAAVAYVTKEDTRVADEPRLEQGEIKGSEQGKRSDVERVRDAILLEQRSAQEVILTMPEAARMSRYVHELVRARDAARWGDVERWRVDARPVVARYRFGPTGCGKTRSVLDAHERGAVYRVTDYASSSHPWDAYGGQPVLCLDEFRGQVPLSTMLHWLDVYPVDLAARYENRTAAWVEVWVLSNEPLTVIYESERRDSPESWRALLDRFASVERMTADGVCVDAWPEGYARSSRFTATGERVGFEGVGGGGVVAVAEAVLEGVESSSGDDLSACQQADEGWTRGRGWRSWEGAEGAACLSGFERQRKRDGSRSVASVATRGEGHYSPAVAACAVPLGLVGWRGYASTRRAPHRVRGGVIAASALLRAHGSRT